MLSFPGAVARASLASELDPERVGKSPADLLVLALALALD